VRGTSEDPAVAAAAEKVEEGGTTIAVVIAAVATTSITSFEERCICVPAYCNNEQSSINQPVNGVPL